MPTLREVFTPLIAYTLLFVRMPVEQQRSFAEIHAEISRLLEEQRAAVRRFDISPADYENACFAVVAWLDETLLRHFHSFNAELFAHWRHSPLQVELYKTANAGEEFFDRLAQLTPAQKEVTELYYLALCLGFRGRYYNQSQDVQLVELRHQYAAHLPAPVIEVLDFEKRQEHVTPQPYTVAAPAVKPPFKRISPYWIAASIAAAAAVLLLYLLWPSGPGAEEVQEAVRSFPCADISFAIDHGVIKLTGRVESDEQREQVHQKVEAIHGVRGVADDFITIPRPFCEVMDVLRPLKEISEKSGFDLEIRPSKGCNATYFLHDDLLMDVIGKKPLHYVYVDYYFADHRTVAHVFPNPQQANNALNNDSALTLGDKVRIKIDTPLGREMVTVISSPKPLFSATRLPPDSVSEGLSVESATAYLAVLERVLRTAAPDTGMAAAYCFTVSAPP